MTACAAIRRDRETVYPAEIPFDPAVAYPEYEGEVAGGRNDVYDALRLCLRDLGMDAARFGTPGWSPFSEFVRPGDTVVVKPNLVLHTADPAIQDCTTTHPSLIRAVIDYAWKALRGEGRIIVGDACSAEADFDEIARRTGLGDMIGALRGRGVPVELRDFRAVKVTSENGVWTGEQRSVEKEAGQLVRLGAESFFARERERYRRATLHGAGYDIAATNRHHHGDTQEYLVSGTILRADVVISMPKMKTHRKAGFTCCLKNLVGINVDKDYLPHFAMGSVNMGGDEMPEIGAGNAALMRLYNFLRRHLISRAWRVLGGPAAGLLRCLRGKSAAAPSAQPPAKDTDADLARWLHSRLSGQGVAAGAWAGNGTIVNMILDLNRIFLCCGRDGALRDRTDRRVFYVADAVLSGMGNGPTHPTPAHVGAVACGRNGLALDTALLRLLGVDEDSIPLYRKAKLQQYMRVDGDGPVLYNGAPLADEDRFGCGLVAPEGWEYKGL